jgi:hypothetical protein
VPPFKLRYILDHSPPQLFPFRMEFKNLLGAIHKIHTNTERNLTRTHIHIDMHPHTHAPTLTRIHTHTHTWAYNIHIHGHTDTHMHSHTHTHTHTHTRTHTRTHTHTHTHVPPGAVPRPLSACAAKYWISALIHRQMKTEGALNVVRIRMFSKVLDECPKDSDK